MSTKLIIAITAITLALVFYTIGVFAERRSHILKKWHVVTFWIGLLCDSTGTFTMSLIARGGDASVIGMKNYIHGVTGLAAILLMIFHAVWATVVLKKQDKNKLEKFHKFSMVVWTIWLIPYLIGMFMGMA